MSIDPWVEISFLQKYTHLWINIRVNYFLWDTCHFAVDLKRHQKYKYLQPVKFAANKHKTVYYRE